MNRTVLFIIVAVLALATAAAWFTPWWFFPGTNDWRLQLSRPGRGASFCVPAGDTAVLRAWRSGAVRYASDDPVARQLGRFRWRLVPPTDSFWVEQRRAINTWLGRASIDERGRLVGSQEGIVGVEVREGSRRIVVPFTIVPALTLDVQPANPTVPVGDWLDLRIDARFADGTVPPARVAPRISIPEWITLARQAPTTRGNSRAPWWTSVRPNRPGTQHTSLDYLGRVVDIAVTATASTAGERPLTALGDSMRRDLYPTPDVDTTQLSVTERFRDASLRRECIGLTTPLYFPPH